MDKKIIAALKLAHGSYNTLVFLLFIYQGLLGIRIRRQRRAGGRKFEIVKSHRKLGPVLALMGVLGFFFGVTLAMLDYGHLLKYPLHFINGLALAVSIFITFLVSMRIRGLESPLRTPHFVLGIAVLCLYLIQIFLGLAILL